MTTEGEVAYEGYCFCTKGKSLATGDDLPEWQYLPAEIQAAWEAAAQAVLDRGH